jgi:hypothetical protein
MRESCMQEEWPDGAMVDGSEPKACKIISEKGLR